MKAYEAQADIYSEQMKQYQKDLSKWEIERNGAVSSAEGLIEPINDNFKWTFVDKRDKAVYFGKIFRTWMMQGIIILVLFVVATLLIWRKDKVS